MKGEEEPTKKKKKKKKKKKNCHTNSTYVSKFQVYTVTNIEVIRQNVFSHTRVRVICVSSDINLPSEHQTVSNDSPYLYLYH